MAQYIFYITPTSKFAVCKEEYWREHQCLDDQFDKELSTRMKGMGFVEVGTNLFACPDLVSVEDGKKLLIENGFTLHFQVPCHP